MTNSDISDSGESSDSSDASDSSDVSDSCDVGSVLMRRGDQQGACNSTTEVKVTVSKIKVSTCMGFVP